MDANEILERLVEVEEREKSNTHRLDSMEEQLKAVNELAKAVAVMASEQRTMNDKLCVMGADVQELKAEPGKRWKFVVEKAIYFFVAAVAGYLLAKLGLKV